jgi:hypothetical protein
LASRSVVLLLLLKPSALLPITVCLLLPALGSLLRLTDLVLALLLPTLFAFPGCSNLLLTLLLRTLILAR